MVHFATSLARLTQPFLSCPTCLTANRPVRLALSSQTLTDTPYRYISHLTYPGASTHAILTHHAEAVLTVHYTRTPRLTIQSRP